MNEDQGQSQTGTRNETYDVIAVLYHALQGAENCQTYLKDAQDPQLRQFFEQALNFQRQLADQGKQVLQQALQKETGGGSSAFGLGSEGGQPGGAGRHGSQRVGVGGAQSFADQGRDRANF